MNVQRIVRFGLGAAALAAFPAATASASTFNLRHATVKSVDGPGLVTVQAGSRTLPLRLEGIDVPRAATASAPAECGAEPSTDSLRRILAKPTGVWYSLQRSSGVDPAHPKVEGPVRDASGRLIADMTTQRRKSYSVPATTVSARLIAAGFARRGIPVPGAGVDIVGTRTAWDVVSDTDTGEYPFDAAAWARRGLWQLCGGRFHLPSGTPPTPIQPAPWTITSAGILQRIGAFPIKLLTSDTSLPMTFGGVRVAFPDSEVVTTEGVCFLEVPSMGVEFYGLDPSGSETPINCDTSYVFAAQSTVRGVATTLGGQTGDSAKSFLDFYPHGTIEDDQGPPNQVYLGPQSKDGNTTAGLVTGRLSDHGNVLTFAAPIIPLDFE